MNPGLSSGLPRFPPAGAFLRGRVRVSPAASLAIAALFVPIAAAGQQPDGEGLFRQRCSGCHSMEPGQNRAGPHLAGVFGRTAGAVDGARYSEAMRDSETVWDGQTLDSFLAAPRQVVPGTTMTVAVPDAAERAAIIDHLESQ